MVAFFCPPPFMYQSPSLSSELIGVSQLYQSSGAISWPVGVQINDLAIIIAVGNSDALATGWIRIVGDTLQGQSRTNFLYKSLVSSDLSSPPNITAPSFGSFYVVVYRGGNTVTKRSTNSSSSATLSVAGFTKAPNSRAIIAASHDLDVGSLSSPPSGFSLVASMPATYFSNGVYWKKSDQYVNNSPVDFALVAGANTGRSTLLELA